MLADITSLDEQSGINEALGPTLTTNNYRVWIGLNDIAVEGQYVLSDNTPATYFNWNAGEPQGAAANPDEDCVTMFPSGFWGDLACSDANPTFGVLVEFSCPG